MLRKVTGCYPWYLAVHAGPFTQTEPHLFLRNPCEDSPQSDAKLINNKKYQTAQLQGIKFCSRQNVLRGVYFLLFASIAYTFTLVHTCTKQYTGTPAQGLTHT